MIEILALILALLPEPSKVPAELPRLKTIAQAVALETGDSELRRYVVSVFFHESHFREEVHSGKIKGDCQWTGGAPGKGERIPGTCRSSCLGQILLAPGQLTPRPDRFKAEDLVGTDLAATRRCARVSLLLLDRVRKRCGGPEKALPRCVFGAYGGVRYPKRSKLIKARVATFWKLAGLQRKAHP